MTRILQNMGALALAALALSASAVAAQSYAVIGGEQFFALEWASGDGRGRPGVNGYVTNARGEAAGDVRVMVESLDAAGAITAETIGYVSGVLTPGMRAYFAVRAPAASAYRVRILSWQWLQHSGNMP
jgi:hypothetical protein